MTAFTKIFFSVALLAAGFGLASLLGPPELADRFANVLRPTASEPAWGSLQPLDSQSLNDPSWSDYESVAMQPPAAPQVVVAGKPVVTQPVGEAPLWSPEAPPASRPDPAVTTAIAQSVPGEFGVATTVWRDTTAAVGWPSQDSDTVFQSPVTQTPPAPPFGEPSNASSQAKGFDPAPAWSAAAPSNGDTPWETTPPAEPATTPFSPSPTNNDFGAWSRPVSAPQEIGPASSEPRVASRDLTPITPAVEPAAPSQPVRHVVADGDTLVRLAERYLNDPQRAGDIFLANQRTLVNPDLLPIGAELVIPDSKPVAASGQPANGTAPFARLMGPQPLAPEHQAVTPPPGLNLEALWKP